MPLGPVAGDEVIFLQDRGSFGWCSKITSRRIVGNESVINLVNLS